MKSLSFLSIALLFASVAHSSTLASGAQRSATLADILKAAQPSRMYCYKYCVETDPKTGQCIDWDEDCEVEGID